MLLTNKFLHFFRYILFPYLFSKLSILIHLMLHLYESAEKNVGFPSCFNMTKSFSQLIVSILLFSIISQDPFYRWKSMGFPHIAYYYDSLTYSNSTVLSTLFLMDNNGTGENAGEGIQN